MRMFEFCSITLDAHLAVQKERMMGVWLCIREYL